MLANSPLYDSTVSHENLSFLLLMEELFISLLGTLPYHGIDPNIFQIGRFAVRWYSFLYVFGFFLAYFISRRLAQQKWILVDPETLDQWILWLFICVVGLSRIFYVIFYNPWHFSAHPLDIFKLWKGGLSFHGGLAGTFLATYLYAKKYKLPFMRMMDVLSLSAGWALGLGRIGNFINGELYGRPSDLPWAMQFPLAGGQIFTSPRHPSQLYESLIEGFVLAALMWWLKGKNLKNGMLTAIFIVGYGLGRFIVEFFREPDPQLGFVAGPLSMGQLLCMAMWVLGGVLIWWFYQRGDASRGDDTSSAKK
jgi:phosphatidylglycerol:prolipoprotein diacylglycerol transferase